MRKSASIKLCCHTLDCVKKFNLKLAVQIPHPTQGKVKFPTHLEQVMVKCWGVSPRIDVELLEFHNLLVHVKHACVCSSRARWPVAPNFCSWATRNLSFFMGIIYAGHTGFHKFRALGSHQFFLEHSLALYIGVIMIIIK